MSSVPSATPPFVPSIEVEPTLRGRLPAFANGRAPRIGFFASRLLETAGP
jgi:hypothetical protein